MALTTHINADGDGCGSETALARLLRSAGHRRRGSSTRRRGRRCSTSCSATTCDDQTSRGVEGAAGHRPADRARHQRREAARHPGRDGARADGPEARHRPSHRHPTSRPGRASSRDTAACATGELVYDLATRARARDHAGDRARRSTRAMLTDTGGFRFSNTSPRCHARRGAAARAGVDPEDMYPRIYASAPAGRLQLLRDALGTLEVDEAHRPRVADDERRRARAVRREARRISTGSSSIRGRSPARAWRCSSAISATAR